MPAVKLKDLICIPGTHTHVMEEENYSIPISCPQTSTCRLSHRVTHTNALKHTHTPIKTNKQINK